MLSRVDIEERILKNKEYSASLTGEPLQFFESRVVAKLIQENIPYEVIKSKVYEENLFNYKTKKSIYKRVASVYRRIHDLDSFLIDMIVDASSSDAKAVILFSIMRTNRFFDEFMKEVIRIKFLQMDLTLTKKDMNVFFERKREQSDEVAHWHEYTVYKLQQVILKILKEAEVLSESQGNLILNKIIINQNLLSYFSERDKKYFLECIGW
jgi:hypothetical protein